MNKNIKPIDSLRNAFKEETPKKERRLTLNEMIYNDEYEEYEDSPGYENVPDIGGEEKPETAPAQKGSENEMANDPEIMEMLSNIRVAVIQGLAKLANRPETVEYSLMKKVLQLIDKQVETQEKI